MRLQILQGTLSTNFRRYTPASPPENADNNSPIPPTPTLISSSPNKSEPFIKSEIVSDARSKTRNFVRANGNSLEIIGNRDDQKGVMSSS